MSEFLSMGGYALYVWGAYAVCAVVLIGLAAISWHRLKSAERTLRTLEQTRRPRRRGAEPPAGTSQQAESVTHDA